MDNTLTMFLYLWLVGITIFVDFLLKLVVRFVDVFVNSNSFSVFQAESCTNVPLVQSLSSMICMVVVLRFRLWSMRGTYCQWWNQEIKFGGAAKKK
jgi:hypothetical protein